MKNFHGQQKKALSVLATALMLSACSQEDNEPKPDQLSAAEVNALIAESEWHGKEFLMDCGTTGLQGCFISEECDALSATYSDRTVYSLEEDNLSAFVISYRSGNCSGEASIHPTSWSYWHMQKDRTDQDTGQADLTVQLGYYGDGFLFDSNKPRDGIVYRSALWVDDSMPRRLCLSDGLMDPRRPLKFMDTQQQPLDPNLCAVALE